MGSPRREILQSLKEAKTNEVSDSLIRFYEKFFQKLEVRERLGLHCSAPITTSPQIRKTKRENCGMLAIRSAPAMKFVSCAVWILAALLVVTSLDSIPDPPAVNPCNVSVTSLIPVNQRGSFGQRLDCDLPCTSSPLRVTWRASWHCYEPNCLSDSIAIPEHAADLSPPTA